MKASSPAVCHTQGLVNNKLDCGLDVSIKRATSYLMCELRRVL